MRCRKAGQVTTVGRALQDRTLHFIPAACKAGALHTDEASMRECGQAAGTRVADARAFMYIYSRLCRHSRRCESSNCHCRCDVVMQQMVVFSCVGCGGGVSELGGAPGRKLAVCF